jgi:LacI family transcriptional regulator
VATIKDIARKLNISVSTVSYALNGGPRSVPEGVRQKVLDIAKELDYRPNRVARSLVTGLCGVIGIVPPSIESDVFNSPFVRMTWNALVNEAEALGQDLLLFAGHNRNSPDQAGSAFLDGRIDGIVFIAPRSDAGAVPFLCARNFPAATIAGGDQGCLTYKVDNEGGVRQALGHLYSLGHRRIAHLAGSPLAPDSVERQRTYLEWMSEKPDVELREGYIQNGWLSTPGGFQAGLRLLEARPRPTAVFASNDEMAYGLSQALHAHGLSIPRDLSIVGFDDCDLSYAFNPPMSTVRQPIAEMASAALRSVVALVRREQPTPATVFPTELVVRASTAPVGVAV